MMLYITVFRNRNIKLDTTILCSYHRCHTGSLCGNFGGAAGVQGEYCHVGVCGVKHMLFS